MNRPVWEMTKKITEAGWYWYGGRGDSPIKNPQLLFYEPDTFWDPHWIAKVDECILDQVMPEMRRPDLKIDDCVLVKNLTSQAWTKRYFAGWDGDFILTWGSGRTSWSAFDESDKSKWPFWKLLEEDA